MAEHAPSKVARLPTSSYKPPGVPRSIRTREARELWKGIVRRFEVEPHHHALLEQACIALDRATDARLAIEQQGLMIEGQAGKLKMNPAAAIERDSRIGMARLLRELGLDAEVPA